LVENFSGVCIKVVFIYGPTASGKSDLALKIAQKTEAAIINSDSLQFYSELQVGSARPSAQELAAYEHYMFGTQSVAEPLTAGQFTKKVLSLLNKIKDRKKLTVVVGGSGFYTYSLITGMFEVPAVDEDLKKSIQNELKTENGPERLLAEIKAIDPQTFEKLHANDHYRIGRAVEILRSSGKRVSDLLELKKKNQINFPYPFLEVILEVDRSVLLQRIQQRTQNILKGGILQELMSLQRTIGVNYPAMQSVGYKQALLHLQNQNFDDKNINFEQLATEIVQATMRLAKKQKTWNQRELHGSMLRYDFQDHEIILKTIVDWL
jgi:tRNA dimethylallyltransferase